MKISVCMIVKNEEEHLPRSLSSIPTTYETIVIDTGSTDRSIDIAKNKGATVIHHTWTDDFSAARNLSLQHATGDYILVLDADEELCTDIEQQVEDYLQICEQRVGSVIIENVNDNESTRHRTSRIFPSQNGYRYVGVVHEQLESIDNIAGQEVDTNILIYHYGYTAEEYKKKDKYNRYSQLYLKILENDKNNGYMLYQLGKLHYSNKNYSDAYKAYIASMELGQFGHYYFPVMLVQLAYTLKELGFANEAIELISPFIDQYPRFPDLPFVLGVLSMEVGNFQQMDRYYKLALSIGDTDKYTTVVGTGTFRAAHNLGVYYELLNQMSDAASYYSYAAQYHFKPSIERLSKL
ncbi:glycosyltransferase [Paenibacillus sp. GCM10023252]|uniref:glycosyltransferase n=1 Tax=Paenibacillus sp. GCM10023252 TaxID=3252649 RepID=UPI003621D080